MNNSVNSKTYWNERFSSDWVDAGGIEQSRFFANIAVQALPEWLRTLIRIENMTVCDWGCAQGDGTDALRARLGVERVTGVDFSETAVNHAITRYPGISFLAQDWLSMSPSEKFDIVFSSNTLEHFAKPHEVINKISKNAEKLLILALPFREAVRIPEHEYSFFPENISFVINSDWTLVSSRVIDCAQLTPRYWPGEQIVLVYAKRNWNAINSLRLADINISQESIAIDDLRRMLHERDKARAELEAQINCLNQAIAVRDANIDGLLNSRSWRMTVPLRALSRLARNVPLSGGATHWYRRGRYLLDRYSQGVHKHGFLRSIPLGARGLFMFSSDWLNKKVRHRDYEEQLRRLEAMIIGHAGFIDLFHVPMGWGTPLFQRFQHMSLQASQLGGLALYGGHRQVDKELFVFECAQGNVVVFDALDDRVVECVFNALRKTSQKKILRLQSIDIVTRLSDVERFISDGITVVYEYIDEINEEITGAVPDFIKERHKGLLQDERVIVVATADKLYDEVRQHRNGNCLLSTNGVDLKHWRKAPQVPPTDMERALQSGRIVVGYHGAFAKWVDYDLLKIIADDGNYELVLIGYEHDTSLAESGLTKHPCVHFLGTKSYFDLNKYASFYDIGILPFKRYSLTESVSPVKLFEYMAAGKPVVTTDLRECSKYESCLVADSHEAFLRNLHVAAALKNDETYMKLLKRDAERNSWLEKAAAVLRLAGAQFTTTTAVSENTQAEAVPVHSL